ncbi:SDR family NAD(P)-dependent oxidoreductase [Streptomyces sp. NPDC004296]|uniref:SDR family NAD(P)-dependent oxidoreductase n=1 Tax=Streptomyces sp. NPDC004296 TaxID=3364697 RepID=UPI0036922A33
MPARTLKDKVVVVGGASRNLGGLISRQLGEHGAKVVVHYNSDSSRSGAEETAAAAKQAGGDAVTHQADLTRVAGVEGLFDAAFDAFGRVDASVNTAGIVVKKPMTETSEAEYDRMFAVNSKAAYFMMREAAKRIDRDGSIITVVTSLLAAYTGLYSVYAGSESPDAMARTPGPGRGVRLRDPWR